MSSVPAGNSIDLTPDHARAASAWLPADLNIALSVRLSSGPDGDHEITVLIDGGTMAVVESGPIEPGVVVEAKWRDAVAIATGHMHPTVAYMTGALKPSGEMSAILALLVAVDSEAFASWINRAG